MMKHAKLLDCTLRDGAYLIEKKFGDETIRGMIHGLMDANIDIIEIGFFQDDGFGDGKTIYRNGSDAERFIPKEHKDTMFTVLADYSRYSVENLDLYTGRSVDAVRVCFFKKERYGAVDFCKTVKAKGYKVFVQPVDILGYTDEELIELLRLMGATEPYCVSIVDTFGSMYQEDLERVFCLIDHNLPDSCRIGFHSHNNMQLSNALTQHFLRLSYGKREVVVDSTISGMGRGAGNTPTELVAQYMVERHGYSYNMDAILDVIDTYMPGIRARCEWGYTTQYFIAGCYSAHVNNITYLLNKNCVSSKDIRFILNKIGSLARKRYDYDLLESVYIDHLSSNVDDSEDVVKLGDELVGRDVLVIVPGPSSISKIDSIYRFQEEYPNGKTIAVNHVPEQIHADYIFMSNVSRYAFWKQNDSFDKLPKIYTSNLREAKCKGDYVIAYQRVIKCGWENMENATILLLRLLDQVNVGSIGIAGFDGYDYDPQKGSNYSQQNMELKDAFAKAVLVNHDILEMLKDYMATRQHEAQICFVTPSRFEGAIE